MSQFFKRFLGVEDETEYPIYYQHFVYWAQGEVVFEIIQVKFNKFTQKKEFIHLRFFKNKIHEKKIFFSSINSEREGDTFTKHSTEMYFYEMIGLQPLLDLLFGDSFTPVRLLSPAYYEAPFEKTPRYPVMFILTDVSIFDLPEDMYSDSYQVHYFIDKLKKHLNGPGIENIPHAIHGMLTLISYQSMTQPYRGRITPF